MARAFFVIVIIASLAAISAWGKAMLTLRGLAFGLSLGVAGGLLQYLVQVQIHPGLNAGWAVVAVVVYGLAGVAGTGCSARLAASCSGFSS